MMQTKPFYNTPMEEALRACQIAGYTPAYMPELAERRIKAKANSALWNDWWTTPSLRITGTTSAGSKVVLYVHDQTSWNDPEKLKYAREHHKNGAGPFPQEEFNVLVDRNGDGKVFLVDYDKLRSSPSGIISVNAALEHPQTIPFLGGDEKLAQRYLNKHGQVKGNKIGIWRSDDLKDQPYGRLLFLGDGISSILDGVSSLSGSARFFGVRRGVSEANDSAPLGAAAKNHSPDLEVVLAQVFASSERFVLEINRKKYEAEVRRGLRKLY